MIHKRWIAIAAIAYLAFVSMLAAPSLAAPKTTTGNIHLIATQNAQNQATPIGKGKGKPTGSLNVGLDLSGSVSSEGNGVIKISGLSGSLTLANGVICTITGGKGEINKKGTIEIQAYATDTSVNNKKDRNENNDNKNDNKSHGMKDNDYELILHGTITPNGYGYNYYYYYYSTGGPVHFTSPQSKLSSMYFLSILDCTASFTWP